MAILTQRIPVCDGKHAKPEPDDLVSVTLQVDGRRSKKIYCPRHAAPFVKLLDEMGGGVPTGGRGRIYTPEEIAAKKRAPKKG